MQNRHKFIWLITGIAVVITFGLAIHIWRKGDENASAVTGRSAQQSVNLASPQRKATPSKIPSVQLKSSNDSTNDLTQTNTTEELLADLRRAIESKSTDLPNIISKLKVAWGDHPPVDLLLDEIFQKDASVVYRQILIDALGSYKRSLTDDEKEKVYLEFEALFSDETVDIALRIAAIQRYAAFYVMMNEEGLPLGLKSHDTLFNYLKTAEKNSPLYMQILTSMATMQDKRLLPELKHLLANTDDVEPEMLRTVVGAAGILKEQELKDQLISILDTTTDERVYRTTVYSLGRMADYSVIEALNRNYDKLNAGPLIKHVFKSNKDVIMKGIEGSDIPSAKACIAATARTADSDSLDAIIEMYADWDEQTRLYTIETLSTSQKTPELYIEKMRQLETSDKILNRIDTLIGKQESTGR